MGRPSKLQPEIVKALLNYVRIGQPIVRACDLVGIDRSTLSIWLKRGANPKTEKDKEFTDFFNSYKKAIAEGEIELLAKIRKGEDKNWQRLAWLLERRHPQEWGRRDNLTVKSYDVNMSKLSDGQLKRIIAGDSIEEVLASGDLTEE